MILKTILFFVLVWLGRLVLKQYKLGRQVSKGKVFLVDIHKNKGKRILWFIITAVVVVEVMVRWKGGVESYDMLLISHIIAAILFVLGIVLMNWKLSGVKNKRLHKITAYSSLLAFIVMFSTAIPIILRL